MTLVSLDDDFGEYEALTEDEQDAALREGIVVLDTNVVLNLYRYDQAAAEALFAVLELVGDRLFMPHQVAREFWSRRRSVISQRSKDIDGIVGSLEKYAKQTEETLVFWRRRTGAAESVVAELQDPIAQAITSAKDSIVERANATEHHVATRDDGVLARLRLLFEGKVGAAPGEQQMAKDVSEGLRRFENKTPPGFGDTSKSGDARAGDYLVWIQALREAEARGAPYLVMVTEDSEKGDWYDREEGETLGASLALVRESAAVAKSRLLLVRTTRLLNLARRALDAQVTDESITSIDEVSSAGASWTHEDIEVFMDRLETYSWLHAKVVEEAAFNGGRISRARVYEMGNFDSDRTLRGFTRPARTVMRQLLDENALSSRSLPEPLVALYESPDSYVVASHFGVPIAFVRWHTAEEEESSSSS
jgi:hypothetical protein